MPAKSPTHRNRGLSFPFGQYKGELIEKVLLTDPGYIDWLLSQSPLPQFSFVYDHINLCIRAFDFKPFIDKKCSNHNHCSNPVTRISLYKHNPSPYYWCDDCDPYSNGAMEGVLTLVQTYKEALAYVAFRCGGSKGTYKTLIQVMQEVKGFGGRRTTERILGFFHA